MKVAIVTTDNRELYKDYKASTPQFGTAPEALLQGFALLPELEVHVLSCAQAPMNSPQKLAPNIWFHSLHVPKLGWMRTVYQGCIRAIRARLKQIQPDIVHGQGTERECAISTIFSGYPNVLTLHGNMRLLAKINKNRPFSFGWLAARLETFTIPRSAGVVCITRYTQEAVTNLARRTWVVPNAVDSSFFDIQPVERGPKRLILCIGTIWLRKNQNRFIRALDTWAPSNHVKVLFLGHADKNSEYGAEFFELIRSRPWCIFNGFADRNAIKSHLETASLLALPSLEDNCPMVVLEAMAAGVPVMAANVGGVPDLVEQGRTGWLCDPVDQRSIQQAVEAALSDPNLALTVVKTAKQQALDRFHPRKVAQRHLEIYRQILDTLE